MISSLLELFLSMGLSDISGCAFHCGMERVSSLYTPLFYVTFSLCIGIMNDFGVPFSVGLFYYWFFFYFYQDIIHFWSPSIWNVAALNRSNVQFLYFN